MKPAVPRFLLLLSVYILPAALINLGNVAAYLFQLVLGRSMSAAQFGVFNGVFSLVLIATAPTGVLHLIVAHIALAGRGGGGVGRPEDVLRPSLIVGACFATAVVAVGLIASSVARPAYDMSVIMAAIMTVAIAFLQPVPAGVLQAKGKNSLFAFVQFSISFTRLMGGVIFVAVLSMGVSGALLACALSLLISLTLGLILLRNDLALKPRSPVRLRLFVQNIFLYGWPQLLTALLITSLMNLDLWIVQRIATTPDEAGLYAAASVIARMSLLLPGALSSIIFVEALRKPSDIRTASISLLVVTGFSVLVALPVLLFPETFLTVMLGEKYAHAREILRYIASAMACMAVSQAAMMILLSKRSYTFIPVLLFAVLSFLILAVGLRPPALVIAQLLLATNALVLVIALGQVFAGSRWRPASHA